MEVKAFIARMNQPKGKLGPWENAIFELRDAGISYRGIVAFLGENGVTVTVSAVHDFVHARKRAYHRHQQDATSAARLTNASLPQGQLPRLDWEVARQRAKAFKW